MIDRIHIISVAGGSVCSEEIYKLAYDLGYLLAKNNFAILCGGLSGVMTAVCEGAIKAGGLTIGILPTYDPNTANPFIKIAIPTGLGKARNVIVANSGEVLVAINGHYGTLSEIALALNLNKPVISLKSWIPDDRVYKAETPEDVLNIIKKLKG